MAQKNDMTVNYQWANRPADQRFMDLGSLQAAVAARTDRSIAVSARPDQLVAIGTDEGQLFFDSPQGPLIPTNWSFGQIASAAKAPASYLRKIPSPLTADCLNWGLRHGERDENLLLLDKENHELRAVTSMSYGRIWDHEVVNGVIRINEEAGGAWKVPVASYQSKDPGRATTLYASDRDVFIFLCDEQHLVEFNGEQLKRGFYVWNSETGSQTFGIATFLYRMVCDNRIIWGQENKQELRIRHSIGAPERFVREGAPALKAYAESSTEQVIAGIRKAKALEVGRTDNDVMDWIAKQGFTPSFSKRVYETAMAEEGRCASVWDVANGLTAVARGIQHTDTRVDLERRAGRIIEKIQ
jgi:hypothetical protein